MLRARTTVFCLAGLLVASAAVLAGPAPGAGKASAGPLELRLRSARLVRRAVPFLAGAAGPMEAGVRAEWEVSARDPGALEAVVLGPQPPFEVRAGPAVIPAEAEVVPGEPRPLLRLHVPSVAPTTRSLRSVEGRLLAYPQARRVRFHIPWARTGLPLRVQFGGAEASLTRTHLVGSDYTLTVTVTPAPTFRMAPAGHTGAVTARAVDLSGNYIQGGGIASIERVEDAAEPTLRLRVPGLERTPARLMLDVLFVSGEARARPFRLGPIPLQRASAPER